ncbi:MAG: ABC transporter ATP-binding protein, partial [Clostridia bacterium]|nr:ABC transporter ATP-binding protein [Clostridia bacterium]
MPPRPKANPRVLLRVIRMLFGSFPVLLPLTIVCILISAATAAIPSIFMQQIIADIERFQAASTPWSEAAGEILPQVMLLLVFYVISLIAIILQTQLMAIITQGFLCKFRREMFDKMQNLPIRYFDTQKHGDIMSRYTNDIDALRELVSQSLPSLLQCMVVLTSVLFLMLYFSVWMTLVLLCGVAAMVFASKKIGGGSAKYFVRQQRAMGKTEGFVQEMMNGQKVIKVFNHEEKVAEEFKAINQALFEDSAKAHAYANTLGPIIGNIGNILYVIMAVAGGIFLLLEVPNVSIGAFPVFGISIVVPFLNMAKQFTGNVNQASQQINAVVMGMAGGARLFEMMDEAPEADEGYVTLVNAKLDENGNLTETTERTGMWAWRHPHQAEGTVTYTPLRGDVRLTEVDFAYEEGKNVLHDVSVYAEPGQKVAFVGATGAGKTTITNLINRYYDIADGKIRYDGININKIKKDDLRRSLG